MFDQGYVIPILCASCIWFISNHEFIWNEEKFIRLKMSTLVIQVGKCSVFSFSYMPVCTADTFGFYTTSLSPYFIKAVLWSKPLIVIVAYFNHLSCDWLDCIGFRGPGFYWYEKKSYSVTVLYCNMKDIAI